MDKEFYLIRHGQSMGNVGLDSGPDPNLSPKGHAQAQACAALIEDYCDEDTLLLSSPFERCLKTADAIAEANSLSITITPELHEIFSNEIFSINRVKLRSLKKCAEAHPLVKGIYNDEQWWPTTLETQEEIRIRMGMFRNRLLTNEFNAQKIICVGHWASIALLAQAMETNLNVVDNASITAIFYEDDSFSEKFSNKISY